MNILDIIIGIVLLLFALAGLRKGLIIEAFYLASIIVGIYGAMYFSDAMSEWLSELINVAPEYLALIAFIITFIVFMIIIRMLGRIISGLVEAIHLGFIDKIGGFVFGVIKGALLLSILIMILNIFSDGEIINRDTRKDSALYPHIENIANTLYKNQELIEESMERSFDKGKDFFEEGFDRIEDVVETSLTK